MQGAVMWFWLAGGIVFMLVVLVLLRLSTGAPDLGAVSDGWLARHKADRRSSDF
jgi:amino acid transporter